MMPLQGDRTALHPLSLPLDPENGQVVVAPEGQTLGGANVINIHRGGRLLGSISQVIPVLNSSGKYEAVRVASSSELKADDLVRVQGWQHTYHSMKFVEGFGWIGLDTTEAPISLMDKHLRVLDVFPIGAFGPEFYLYEKVCLQKIREGETHEKPTIYSPTAPSRNKTPPSSGPSSSRGSSGSAPRTDPATGSSSGVPRKPTLVDAD